MKWEDIDLSQLPSGYYEIPENYESYSKTQGYAGIGPLYYPFDLYGLHCIKDDESGNIWARNPKTWKWQLLVDGNKK